MKKLIITIIQTICLTFTPYTYTMLSHLGAIDYYVERHTKQARLFVAIAQHDIVSVKKLIDAKAYVNFNDVTIHRELWSFTRCHHDALALENRTDPHGIYLYSLLNQHNICHKNDKVADNIKYYSPLSHAIRQESLNLSKTNKKFYDTITTLINTKADVNGQDREGITPLMAAFQPPWGSPYKKPIDVYLIKILIDAKADINKSTLFYSDIGYGEYRPISPLLLAYNKRSPEALRILLAHKANINQPITHFSSKKTSLIHHLRVSHNKYQTEEVTPLMLAIAECKISKVQQLLELGANVTTKNINGDTALTLTDIDRYNTLEWIKHYDRDHYENNPGEWFSPKNHSRNTKISYWVSIVQMLIIAGANPHNADKEGELILAKIIRQLPAAQTNIENALTIKQQLNELEEQTWELENISSLLQDCVQSKDVVLIIGQYIHLPYRQNLLCHPLVISYLKRKKYMAHPFIEKEEIEKERKEEE